MLPPPLPPLPPLLPLLCFCPVALLCPPLRSRHARTKGESRALATNRRARGRRPPPSCFTRSALYARLCLPSRALEVFWNCPLRPG